MHIARSADGTRIAFDRQGSGPVIVLVHGTTGSSEAWVFVAPLLAQEHTVVTMDRRGHGHSEPGAAYSLAREGEDVAAVVAAVGETVHIVGHSGGARAALAAAPGLDGLRSLTLYEPPLALHHVPPDVPDRTDALIAAGDRDAAARTFLHEAGVTEDEVTMMRSIPEVWDRVTAGAHNAPRDIRAFLDERVDLVAAGRITAPALLLVGAETSSPVYLDGLDELERALPDSRRELISGQRHMANAFAPDQFADAVLQFLRSVGT